MDTSNNDVNDPPVNVPKKRGRKPKQKQESDNQPKPPPKKRGRKPKGGKIIPISLTDKNNEVTITNIILHLKCSMNDLNENDIIIEENYNPNVETIESFNIEKDTDNFSNIYELDNESQNTANKSKPLTSINKEVKECEVENNNVPNYRLNISEKINKLQHDLILNNVKEGSACFWCTEYFDTPVINIPKHKCNSTNKYIVYGCFCSPECASAHLMNENINDSEKFERYHLLNFIYGSIYNYTKNIRPAPNPYYTLSKFLGNLTIQEYRNLFMYEKLLLVIDKPLTRNLPQIFEDNDNYKISKKSSKINSFKMQNKNAQNKNEILSTNFGGN